jgi:geranylgeranyl reductase family protein
LPDVQTVSADVIVVGAGPAGASAAAHLARGGLDVVVLEKARFPRDKICGDALTPRAVHELGLVGLDKSDEPGWHRNRGLRLIGGGHRLEIDWPSVTGLPDYGLTRPRMKLDEDLARHAQASGATLYENTMALHPTFGADGWVDGIQATATNDKGRKIGPETHFRAPVVLAADGVSARTAVQMGNEKREDRPMGVAVRTYYRTPRSNDEFIESWLELRPKAEPGTPEARRGDGLGDPMPGYGWLFPMGDGTANVGLGILDTSPMFGKVDYRKVLRDWIEAMGAEWQIDETRTTGPVKSAALPMAFNRTPHFDRGVLLLGDAAGMVNPFNGEGIDYAMESGRLAAEVVATYQHYPTLARRRALHGYAESVRGELGSYFTLGRIFAEIIGKPELMNVGIKYGMGSRVLMRFVVKLLANLYSSRASERDLYDHVIYALNQLVPATTND